MNNTSENRFYTLPFTALTTLFGLQMLRVLLALMVNLARDRLGWSAITVGVLALLIFLTPFLLSLLRRWLGLRRLVTMTALGVSLCRMLMQWWTGDPLGDFLLAIGGTILFLWFLPAYLGTIRARGTALFGLGFLTGITIDTALHGFYLTLDMAWQPDALTTVLITLLVAGQWFLFFKRQPHTNSQSDVPFKTALAWSIIGPFLFLQMLWLQNIAWLTAVTGWQQPTVYGVVTLYNLSGIAITSLAFKLRPAFILGIGVAFATGLVLDMSVAVFILMPLLNVVLFGLLVMALHALDHAPGRSGWRNLTAGYGIGMVVLTLLAFMYYGSYDIPMPFPNTILPYVALALILPGVRPVTPVAFPLRRLILALIPLLLLPIYRTITWEVPVATPGQSNPIRLMTYNLHNGFNPEGTLDIEAIAQVIENEHADIVALQEVSRGWMVHGSFDILSWLSQRLEMPFVYGPTADDGWGNGLLSQYPILESGHDSLPPADLLLPRGYIWAHIDVGNEAPLTIIAAHYHHRGPDSDIRMQHTEAILARWQNNPQTVIMGDLNAQPGAMEMMLLRQAGFVDTAVENNIQSGFTFPSTMPSRRIDYIWHSSDLALTDVVVPATAASDHLPVAATIDR